MENWASNDQIEVSKLRLDRLGFKSIDIKKSVPGHLMK